MRRSIVAFCCGALSLIGGRPTQVMLSSDANVRLRLVNVYGSPIDAPAEVEIFQSLDDATDYAKRFSGGSAKGIPFGEYRFKVRTKGFWSTERMVYVGQENLDVVTVLAIGMSENEGGVQTGTITGHINNLPTDSKQAWVRLVGVFSDFIVDGLPSQGGDFVFDRVPHGTYVLVISIGGKVLSALPTTVPHRGSVTINLDTVSRNNTPGQ